MDATDRHLNNLIVNILEQTSYRLATELLDCFCFLSIKRVNCDLACSLRPTHVWQSMKSRSIACAASERRTLLSWHTLDPRQHLTKRNLSFAAIYTSVRGRRIRRECYGMFSQVTFFSPCTSAARPKQQQHWRHA